MNAKNIKCKAKNEKCKTIMQNSKYKNFIIKRKKQALIFEL